MAALFAATIFVSAALLFSVQPILAKLLLPLLGGTPAVWTTCMVFFQGMLLAGYAYAHLVSNWLGPRTQCTVHLALLAAATLALPLGVSEASVQSLTDQTNPAVWLLGCLLQSAGLPFFVISTSAPLLQRWFSQTRHPSAGDPYFLYAASNLGSLIALLSYPLLIEPNLRLRTQGQFWAAAYGVLALSVLACMTVRWRQCFTPGFRDRELSGVEVSSESGTLPCPITAGQRFRWVTLAFVPSSLMLGVTSYLTADVASIPLLWVVPLSIYLLTFVLAFARKALVPHTLVNRLLPIGAVGLAYLLLSEATEPPWLLILLHLGFFFVAALACHGRLAGERPPPSQLTEFYFWLSLGGILGGLFNALVAPNVFNRVIEYPLAIVLACLLRPIAKSPLEEVKEQSQVGVAGRDGWSEETDSNPGSELGTTKDTKHTKGKEEWNSPSGRFWSRRQPDQLGRFSCVSCVSWLPASLFRVIRALDVALPLIVGLIAVALAVLVPRIPGLPLQLRLTLIFGIPLVLAYTLVDRSLRFGLGLSAVLLSGAFYSGGHGRTLHVERNFFGVLRVTHDPEGEFRRLVHGNTVHGRQFIDPARQNEPLSYYHRSGPLGQIFRIIESKAGSTNIAVIGLGAGSMACYAKPHQTWTYYEINPAVIRLAQNTNYFTFLSNSHAGGVRMVVGDARLRLREAPDGDYNLIVLDAFSSDAIPMHLITSEALELYLSKLAAGGLLAFHISNRCLDLQPILGDLAGSADVVCYAHDEIEPSALEIADGKDQSHWVVIGRRVEDLGRLVKDSRWLPISPRAKPQIWTDDFSNIISVFKWR